MKVHLSQLKTILYDASHYNMDDNNQKFFQSLQESLQEFEQGFEQVQDFSDLQHHLEQFQTTLTFLIQNLKDQRTALSDTIKHAHQRT